MMLTPTLWSSIPQVSLEEGLQACVDWYSDERDWARGVDTSDN